MKKFDIGQAATLIANVAVVASIIFLAVEVRQNQSSLDQANDLTRASILSGDAESFSEFRTLLAQDVELSGIWQRGVQDRSDLSESEAQRFDQLCANRFWLYAASYERFRLFGDRTRATEGPAFVARREFENVVIRECWEPYFDTARRWGYEYFVDALTGVGTN